MIGIYDDTLPGDENKMLACKETFASFGVSLLHRLAECPEEWISIDEIGYLEAECPAYCQAIEDLLEKKRVVAVVRKQSIPFLRGLCERPDVFLIDLDQPFGQIACVIMASGMGRRFGGNKLMADFHGLPMILRAIEATDGIFEKRVVVTRHADVAELCRLRGVEYVLHDLPHRNDTVRLGLEAIGETEACVFCPGDQPLLRRETLISLALAAKNHGNHIWRVGFEGTSGAPVLFPARMFSELSSLPEGMGGGFLIKKYPDRIRTVEAQDEWELKDVDTPEDLACMRQM